MSNINSIPYVLVANIIVDEAQTSAFEGAVNAFLDRAAQNGGDRHEPFVRILPTCKHKLRLALKGNTAFVLDPEKERRGTQSTHAYVDRGPVPNECRRYVHVWDVPDLQSLDIAAVMRAIADDKLYINIDAQVFRESQGITAPVQWSSGISDLMPPANRPRSPCLARVDRSFATRTVGVYLIGLRALMTLMAIGDGTNACRLISHVQDVTGRLNTAIEFWQATPESRDAVEVFSDLIEYWRTKEPALMARVYDSWALPTVPHRFRLDTYTLADYF